MSSRSRAWIELASVAWPSPLAVRSPFVVEVITAANLPANIIHILSCLGRKMYDLLRCGGGHGRRTGFSGPTQGPRHHIGGRAIRRGTADPGVARHAADRP